MGQQRTADVAPDNNAAAKKESPAQGRA